MQDKQIIIDGCEFQGDCIEYKDISYLKIMPICAIHELSIACHDKVNKCKYYKWNTNYLNETKSLIWIIGGFNSVCIAKKFLYYFYRENL